jgi:hypothetical protein
MLPVPGTLLLPLLLLAGWLLLCAALRRTFHCLTLPSLRLLCLWLWLSTVFLLRSILLLLLLLLFRLLLLPAVRPRQEVCLRGFRGPACLGCCQPGFVAAVQGCELAPQEVHLQ